MFSVRFEIFYARVSNNKSPPVFDSETYTHTKEC